MDVKPLGRASKASVSVKREPEDENDIKDFAETTMNELLGWYGYDKVDSRDTQGLNLNRFTTKDGVGTSNRNSMDHISINGGNESSSGLDSPTGGSSGGGNGNGPASCHSPTPSQSQASPTNLPNGYVVCAWCQKVGMKLFTLRTNNGIKAFCSEICFTQCRRASFKKYKVCDWCKHIRHTVNYVDFQDGEQQLQFCSDKCLNQYKMNIFCRETQAHLQMHPHLRDASKLLSGACTSSTSGTSGNRNMTLITPELWMRDCKERDVLNGHSDDHISGAESEDKSDGSGTSATEAANQNVSKLRQDLKPSKISSSSTEHCEGKENATHSSGDGELSHRQARLRERVERRRHRHQSKKGGARTHSPLLYHYHHRHNNHIRQVLDKLDKPDKHKNNISHRFSLSRIGDDVTTSDKSAARLSKGSSTNNGTAGLTGGSPISLSSLNIHQHPSLHPNGLVNPPPSPSPSSATNDLLRASIPSQPMLLAHQPPPGGLLRLPPPFPHGIRSPMPFCQTPGVQMPPCLQPFFSNLAQFCLPVPPPTGGPSAPLMTHPALSNNGTLSSLIPPVTVMVPYPVILPIPIPIPIPLPFPMKDFKMPETKIPSAPVTDSVSDESKSNAKVLEGLAMQRSMDDLNPGQRSSHQNPTKRVDSVITRLVNSRMSQIYNLSTTTTANEPSGSSASTMPSPMGLKEEPREFSPSLSEVDDRPFMSDTVHSLAGSNYSNSNYAPNHFPESADEDSFGRPDSGDDSDDSHSTCHSRSKKEFETAVCDGLSIPSSPTSRLRHQLVSTAVDQEPHMKRKCLRTRLLAK